MAAPEDKYRYRQIRRTADRQRSQLVDSGAAAAEEIMVLTTTKEKKTKVLSFSRLWALWKGSSEVPGRWQSGERRVGDLMFHSLSGVEVGTGLVWFGGLREAGRQAGSNEVVLESCHAAPLSS